MMNLDCRCSECGCYATWNHVDQTSTDEATHDLCPHCGCIDTMIDCETDDG